MLGIDTSKPSFQLHGVPVLSAWSLVVEPITGRPHRPPGSAKVCQAIHKSNKNDAADAEAIREAVQRPSMRFVPAKSIEQQDVQSIHRIAAL